MPIQRAHIVCEDAEVISSYSFADEKNPQRQVEGIKVLTDGGTLTLQPEDSAVINTLDRGDRIKFKARVFIDGKNVKLFSADVSKVSPGKST
mgnify:CR=1 FL=1